MSQLKNKSKKVDQVLPAAALTPTPTLNPTVSSEAEKSFLESANGEKPEDYLELLASIATQIMIARGVPGRASKGLAPSQPVSNDIKLCVLDAEEILQAFRENISGGEAIRTLAEGAVNNSEKIDFREGVCQITGVKKFADALANFKAFLQADVAFRVDWEKRINGYKAEGISKFIVRAFGNKFVKYRNRRDAENKKKAGLKSVESRKKAS